MKWGKHKVNVFPCSFPRVAMAGAQSLLQQTHQG